jgi:hypothetical protein
MASPPLRLAAATLLAAATTLTAFSAQAATDSTTLKRWSSDADFRAGTSTSTKISGGAITISTPRGKRIIADPYGDKKEKSYDYGDWTSPWVSTGFDAKTLIPSWNAATSGGTWIRVLVRGKTATKTGSWDTIADWAYGVAGTHRHSGTSQTDDYSRLDVDTVVMNGSSRYRYWQIKVELMRPTGTTATPAVSSIGAVASTYSTRSVATSATTMTANTELAVPRYSQMIHKGEFAQWGGGGASWCSPTSVSMVLRFFKTGPVPADYAWSSYPNSWVDHAARYTYDYRYDGAGNWPFNTAYAGRYGLDAFVTRLNNLRDAEAFIKKGIPVVASVKYAKGALTGAAVSSSAGHLLVIVGVQKDGKVIVNDPAAAGNSTVRRVYQRAQFEKAWLGGSGGVSYIIRPTSKALPVDTARW